MEPDGDSHTATRAMSKMRWSTARVSVLWLALAMIAIAILSVRLQLNFDLSVFFPQKTSLTHDILLEQLKNGPGSRLIVIGLRNDHPEQLATISDQMKKNLAANPAFVNVLNGDYSIETASIPEPVNSYYLLLDDFDYSVASLKKALQLRHQDLAFGGGTMLLGLMARDPFLQTLNILERLIPVNMSGEQWFAKDGSAVLLAETKAPAVDLVAQTRAILAVKQTFRDIPDSSEAELEITGVGAFGVELQRTIRAEAKKRTILASFALLLVLLIVYRKPRLLLLATLPIGMGFLIGLSVVTLMFGSVHGITLAFGFTLMGVAIDYPLHLFSHSRDESGKKAIVVIWPTLRIGAASTVIAYLAIASSGSKGLSQLGVFTATGVIIAALVTRTWLPLLMSWHKGPEFSAMARSVQPSLAFIPAVLTIGLALFATNYLVKGEIWDDQLSSLSPVPKHRIVTDNLLRSAAATADMRYQLVLHEPTLESLLHASESLDLLLKGAVDDGLLANWQSISLILPSQSLQQDRQDAIPGQEQLKKRLGEALLDTPFKRTAFAPFENNAQNTKTLSLLMPEQFEATPLSSWLDSHLIHLDDQWVSLISLSQPRPAELAERINSWEVGAELVDLRQSSLQLVHDYRNGAIKTIMFASLAIITLLLFEHKQPRRVAWIALTVVAALAVTIAVVAVLHNGITIIHLVALLLVMGLGLDYALFLSRSETRAEQLATRHAVIACAITTTLTFSILAVSSIPVLKFLGLTVATGSAASFILAFAGSWTSRIKFSQIGL